MNLVAILIGLVIIVFFLVILYKILGKLFPMLGIDADWQRIIFMIIGLAVLIFIAGYLGYGGTWFAVPR